MFCKAPFGFAVPASPTNETRGRGQVSHVRAINKRNRKEQKDRLLFHMGSVKLKLVKQSMVCYHTGISKKIDTLRELLNLENSNRRSPFEEYYDALESINALVYNYPDWFDDKDVDEQLNKLDKADYNMACALMTLVLREDYWKNGAFDRRYHAGEVTPIDDAQHLQEKAQTDESKAAAKKIYDAMRYSDLTSDEASVQEKNDNEADQRAWSADGL